MHSCWKMKGIFRCLTHKVPQFARRFDYLRLFEPPQHPSSISDGLTDSVHSISILFPLSLLKNYVLYDQENSLSAEVGSHKIEYESF